MKKEFSLGAILTLTCGCNFLGLYDDEKIECFILGIGEYKHMLSYCEPGCFVKKKFSQLDICKNKLLNDLYQTLIYKATSQRDKSKNISLVKKFIYDVGEVYGHKHFVGQMPLSKRKRARIRKTANGCVAIVLGYVGI